MFTPTGIKNNFKLSYINASITIICNNFNNKTNNQTYVGTLLLLKLKKLFSYCWCNAEKCWRDPKEKYEQAQNVPKIGNLVGWMLRAIKDDYQVSKGKNKVGTFNDYEQRPFDPTLEEKLLNWGKNETDDVGEEFQQAKY